MTCRTNMLSSLFVGYVLMQIPSNMLITRIKPGIYMSSWMLIWAVVSACTGLVQNYSGMVACRFMLGVTEAPVRIYSAHSLLWFNITAVLSWRDIYAFDFLHSQRSRNPHCTFVLRPDLSYWFLWPDRCWRLRRPWWFPRYCRVAVAILYVCQTPTYKLSQALTISKWGCYNRVHSTFWFLAPPEHTTYYSLAYTRRTRACTCTNGTRQDRRFTRAG